MVTYEQLHRQLMDFKREKPPQHDMDQWISNFYSSSAQWHETEEKKQDLLLDYLTLQEAYFSVEQTSRKFESSDDDSELAASIAASIESQDERHRGRTPPNEHQIGALEHLTQSSATHYTDPLLKEGIENMARLFPGIRTSRGDGNCYYRSVMYGLVEQMVISPQRTELFDQLIQTISKTIGTYGGQYDADIRDLLDTLHQARAGTLWRNIAELEQDFRDPRSRHDALLIRSARLLTATGMEELPPEFITDTDIQTVLTMGEDAEGAPLENQILLKELGLSGSLTRFEINGRFQPKGQYTELHSKPPIHPLHPHIEVHVLLKPGHYELLYSPEQMAKVQAAQTTQAVHLMKEYKQEVCKLSPSQALGEFLTQLMSDLEHKPKNIKISMDALLDAIDKHPDSTAEMLLNALDELNGFKDHLTQRGYQPHVIARVEEQCDILRNKTTSLYEGP